MVRIALLAVVFFLAAEAKAYCYDGPSRKQCQLEEWERDKRQMKEKEQERWSRELQERRKEQESRERMEKLERRQDELERKYRQY